MCLLGATLNVWCTWCSMASAAVVGAIMIGAAAVGSVVIGATEVGATSGVLCGAVHGAVLVQQWLRTRQCESE